MKTTVEQISPAKAERILADHWVKEHQRIPSDNTVDTYARAMRAGQWVLTHQGIAVDDAGELVDGVHRLLAIARSGVTVPLMVTTGLPHNGVAHGTFVIDAIDRGRERGVGEQLHLRHGIANANLYAAMARGVLILCAREIPAIVGKMSVPWALRVGEVYGTEITYCLAERSRDVGVRNAAPMTACAFAMKACPDELRVFYERLTTGEDLRSGDPALTLRRWLQSVDRHNGELCHRATLTCAMNHVLKKRLTKLYDGQNGYNFFVEKQRQSAKKVLVSCGFVS